MKEFAFCITEESSYVVKVKAETEEEAIRFLKEKAEEDGFLSDTDEIEMDASPSPYNIDSITTQTDDGKTVKLW